MKVDLSLFLKGLAMGAANVIPGVSGGTIALITGIYARLINAIRRVDLHGARLLLRGDLRGFLDHIDGRWLGILLFGVLVSIFSLARLFEYLLARHEMLTMAFFFGLILLSVWYVGRTVQHWGGLPIAALIAGTAIAISTAMMVPASENDAFLYLFLCGVVAISSMVLPGLSGSFVLIIMGNYALVLGAINSLDLSVLVPLTLGCVVGLVAFSHVLAWIFRHFEDATLALMTGFVLGSLVVIWPWKEASLRLIEQPDGDIREVIESYDWFWPDLSLGDTWAGLAMIVVGMLVIAAMEYVAEMRSRETT